MFVRSARKPNTNIYILDWRPDMSPSYVPAREKIIPVEQDRTIRIKAIESAEFDWVFRAFTSTQPLNAISPKLLRAIASRSYEVVRNDIPRKTLQVDFSFLEGAVQSDASFAKLFGLTTVNENASSNATHPYTLTDVAVRLLGKEDAKWHTAAPYVDRVSKEAGTNIRVSDNRYYISLRTGKKSLVHKYSHDFLDLASKMRSGEVYEIAPLVETAD